MEEKIYERQVNKVRFLVFYRFRSDFSLHSVSESSMSNKSTVTIPLISWKICTNSCQSPKESESVLLFQKTTCWKKSSRTKRQKIGSSSSTSTTHFWSTSLKKVWRRRKSTKLGKNTKMRRRASSRIVTIRPWVSIRRNQSLRTRTTMRSLKAKTGWWDFLWVFFQIVEKHY